MQVDPFYADRWLAVFEEIADDPELHAVRGAQPEATLEDGRKIARVLADSVDGFGRTSITPAEISDKTGVSQRVVRIHLIGLIYCGLMDAAGSSGKTVRILHEPSLGFVRDPMLLEDLISRAVASRATRST